MAHPFSVATGALQVAGAGFQLAKTLYDCAKTIKDAETDLEGIANEVNLVAKVLINFGNILDEDEAGEVCSPSLRVDARAALDECKRAFVTLDAAFKSVTKPKESGQMSRRSKWKWPLAKGRTKDLQGNLERLKTTLSLMLEMLGYAKRKTKSRPGEDVSLHEDRIRVERLIAANEHLVRQITNDRTSLVEQQIESMFASSTPTGTAELEAIPAPVLESSKEASHGKRKAAHLKAYSSISTSNDISSPKSMRLDGAGLSFLQHSDKSVLPDESDESLVVFKELGITKADDSDVEDLLLRLQICSDLVSELSSSLNAAISTWRQYGTSEPHAVRANFRSVRHSYKRLPRLPIPGPDDSRDSNPNMTEEANRATGFTDQEGLRLHEASAYTTQPIRNAQRYLAGYPAGMVTGESAAGFFGSPFEWQLDQVFTTAPSTRHQRNEQADTYERSQGLSRTTDANRRKVRFPQSSSPMAWVVTRHDRPPSAEEEFPEEDLFGSIEEATGPVQIEDRSPKIAVSQAPGNNARTGHDGNELDPTGMDTADAQTSQPHPGPPSQGPDLPGFGYPLGGYSQSSMTTVGLENTDEAESEGRPDLKAQGSDKIGSFSDTEQLSEEIVLSGEDAFDASGEDFDGGERGDPSRELGDEGTKAEDAFEILLRRWTTLAA